MNLEQIESEALRLPSRDRARLAERLIASLDEKESHECGLLWLIESEKRYQEYREGKLPGKPAEDVFREAFSKIT